MATKPKYLPLLRRRKTYSSYTKYRHYRQEIAEDCQSRCVYCDIHHQEAGGSESMTIDHLRPSSHYPSLTDDPTNLVWACSPCNQFKGNDWPALGLLGNPTIMEKQVT